MVVGIVDGDEKGTELGVHASLSTGGPLGAKSTDQIWARWGLLILAAEVVNLTNGKSPSMGQDAQGWFDFVFAAP